jgi:hypothetical protein
MHDGERAAFGERRRDGSGREDGNHSNGYGYAAHAHSLS